MSRKSKPTSQQRTDSMFVCVPFVLFFWVFLFYCFFFYVFVLVFVVPFVVSFVLERKFTRLGIGRLEGVERDHKAGG